MEGVNYLAAELWGDRWAQERVTQEHGTSTRESVREGATPSGGG